MKPIAATPASVMPAIEVRRVLGKDCPSELVELRRRVWAQEMGLLPDDDLLNENDRQGIHLLVYEAANGKKLVASTCALEAERSDFAAHTNLPEPVLRDAMLSTRSTVDPNYRGSGLLALLIYLGAREGRIKKRRWLVGFLEPGMVPGRKVTGAVDLANVPPRRVRGRDGHYEVVATAVDTDQVMSNCFARIPAAFHPYLREHFFAEDILAVGTSGARFFYENEWFQAVAKRQLTRWQYFKTLAEMHIYVRWTTRLLGSVIGITPDSELRRHYIQHLAGEIDHEVLLENDIAHLGFDVDYVKHHLTPSEDIRAFMSVQESLCTGPRRDPALFLAVPFAMEALTAFLGREFIDQLEATIASWGVPRPAAAMTFISSHVHTDGGPDGHFEAARRILHRHVRGERDLQEFLSTVRLIQNLLHRAFTSYVRQTDIFAASDVR